MLCFYDYDELYDVVISAFLHDAPHLSMRKIEKPCIIFGQGLPNAHTMYEGIEGNA